MDVPATPDSPLDSFLADNNLFKNPLAKLLYVEIEAHIKLVLELTQYESRLSVREDEYVRIGTKLCLNLVRSLKNSSANPTPLQEFFTNTAEQLRLSEEQKEKLTEKILGYAALTYGEIGYAKMYGKIFTETPKIESLQKFKNVALEALGEAFSELRVLSEAPAADLTGNTRSLSESETYEQKYPLVQDLFKNAIRLVDIFIEDFKKASHDDVSQYSFYITSPKTFIEQAERLLKHFDEMLKNGLPEYRSDLLVENFGEIYFVLTNTLRYHLTHMNEETRAELRAFLIDLIIEKFVAITLWTDSNGEIQRADGSVLTHIGLLKSQFKRINIWGATIEEEKNKPVTLSDVFSVDTESDSYKAQAEYLNRVYRNIPDSLTKRLNKLGLTQKSPEANIYSLEFDSAGKEFISLILEVLTGKEEIPERWEDLAQFVLNIYSIANTSDRDAKLITIRFIIEQVISAYVNHIEELNGLDNFPETRKNYNLKNSLIDFILEP